MSKSQWAVGKMHLITSLFLLFFLVGCSASSDQTDEKDVKEPAAQANQTNTAESPAQPLADTPSTQNTNETLTALTFDEIIFGLSSVIHTINEIGILIIDFVALIKEDPLNGLLQLIEFIGEKFGLIDHGDGIEGDLTLPGPGLGNLNYSTEELFQPIGWINHDNGVPGIYPGSKDHGTNLGMMIDGYFFTLFAPDSGKGPGGFLLMDVSDPHDPLLMKRIYEPEGRTSKLKEPHAFGLARINERRYLAFQSTIGVEFWDFTDLNDLQKVADLDLPGVDGGDYSNVAWQLSWQAPYLYVASSEQGVFIVDATDPANPIIADRGNGNPNPIPPSALGGFRVGPIFAFGNQLVISSMQNRDGIASLDISDPLNPQLLDRIPDLDQFYYASCFNGQSLAISVRGGNAKMELYDVSDLSNIQLQDDQLEVPGQLYCAFQDEFVFQGTEDFVHKINIANPESPIDVGSGTIGGPLVRLVDHGQVSPLGNIVFIGNDHGTGSAFMPHSLTPDTRPPEVVTTLPRDGANNQSTLSRIGIALSDVIDFSSVTEENVKITNASGQLISGIFSVQNTYLNFSPTYPLAPNTEYKIHLRENGLKDIVGNALIDTYTASFTTGDGTNALDLTVDLSLSNITALPGVAANFDVDVLEPIEGLEYQWEFGDGIETGFSSHSLSQHTYEEPGHYQVTLTIRQGNNTQRVTYTHTVINKPTSEQPTHTSTLATTEDTLWIVNPDNDSLSVIDTTTLEKRWELNVGSSPQSVSVDAEGSAWVTLKNEDAIVVISKTGIQLQRIDLAYGAQPFGIVSSPDKLFFLVSLSGKGQLLKLNTAGEITDRLAITDPRAIAIDWQSSEAWVTRFVSDPEQALVYRVGLLSNLSLLETVSIPVDSTTTDTQDRARGVANYLFDITLSPDGQRALVPSKKDNILRGQYRDGQNLTHDSTLRAIISEIDTTAASHNKSQEIDFDNRSGARAVTFSPLGDYVFTALQGSNKIIVSDAYSNSIRVEIETELAPQSIVLDTQGRLYAHNFMSRSVSVYDVSTILDSTSFAAPPLASIDVVSDEQLNSDVLLGKQIFYNADDPRMSRESYISCASCHVDGGQDGMVWDFTERGEGLRNTITLEGRSGVGHGNVHWTANFDEIQDFENDIRGGFGGIGFLTDEQFAVTSLPLGIPKAGLSNDLDALASYVTSLQSFSRNPNRESEITLSEEAQEGKAIYESLNCTTCHTGDNLTDGQRHILYTLVPGSGEGMGQPLNTLGIETPTLKGLWNTAPYFHHGQAKTLADVLKVDDHGNAQLLPADQLNALTKYLLSL